MGIVVREMFRAIYTQKIDVGNVTIARALARTLHFLEISLDVFIPCLEQLWINAEIIDGIPNLVEIFEFAIDVNCLASLQQVFEKHPPRTIYKTVSVSQNNYQEMVFGPLSDVLS